MRSSFMAHCHLGLSRLYGQIGQRQQARAALATAIAPYRAMDMTFKGPRRRPHWRRWREDTSLSPLANF